MEEMIAQDLGAASVANRILIVPYCVSMFRNEEVAMASIVNQYSALSIYGSISSLSKRIGCKGLGWLLF